MDQSEVNADVDLKLAGQEIRLRNVKSFNTIVSLVAAVASCFGIYLLMEHQAQTKEAGKEFVTAIKEQTKAIQEQTVVAREGNCLQVFKDPEQCRRITR